MKLSEVAADRAGEKRRRVVEAARYLILRHGLRGTTMEAIAREAGMAKPTLYAQFPDKDAVFAAIVDGLTEELVEAFRQGMTGKGDLADRVGSALALQFAALNRALDGSPHATELMSEHRRAGEKFREKDRLAHDELAEALKTAGIAEAGILADLVMAASYGIALKATDEKQMIAAIRLLCRRVITPELP